MLDIRQQGNLYTITFSHPDRDQFNLLVESMKEIGAEWDRQTKSWILVEKKRADILLKCKAFSGTPSALLESIRREKTALLGLPPLNGPKAPEGISLMPHQEEGVGFIEQREGSLIAWEVGVGKGQPKSGIVITPDGPRKMGDIRVGDSVLGSDGRPTTVTGVFERGVLPVYRVSFSDGSSLVVDGDHLWNVKSNNCRSKGRKWRTLETRFLASRPMRGPCNEWSIPQCGPAQFTQSSSPLPIDPWLLGALLGDGSFRGGIHFSTADAEMLGRVSGSLPDDTAKLTRDGKYDYRLSRSPLLLSAIRSMGLYGKYSHEKFVPAEYLLAAPYDRLELLRGLMDTDGRALPTGGTEYSTTSAMLKDAVVFIAQSLGGVARVRKRESYLNGVRHLDSYRVNVKLPEGVNQFWLPRKSHAYVEPTKYPPRRYIRSIVPCGEEDVVCISVANPDGLYLAESFIVTHNTGVSIASINAAGQQGFPALIICPAHLKHNWYKELKGDPELNKRGWLIDKSRTVGIASGSYFPPTDVVIINYDILDRHKDKLDSIPWAFAICDECFVAGTMVSTPTGPRPIENIRPGDFVDGPFGVSTVECVRESMSENLYELEFSDGSRIVCTGNHPIFTEKGWTPASRMELGWIAFRKEDLSAMYASLSPEEKDGQGRSDASRRQGSVGVAADLFSILREEVEEPYAQRWVEGQDEEDSEPHWPQAPCSWREREGDDQAAARHSGNSRAGLGARSCNLAREEDFGLSDKLQGGHREPGIEDCNRGGRSLAPASKATGAGCKKGRETGGIGLVRISSYKQKSPSLVYNLQVCGHPSYFANGILVHNCHFCKNPKAKRTKAIIGGSKGRGRDKHQWKPLHAKRRIALSGTPLVNKPEDLWAVCNWLDPKRWPSKYWFESQFCTTQKRKQWTKRKVVKDGITTYVPTEVSIREVLPPSRDQMDKLNKRLTGTIMSRIRSKDVLNLPPLIRRVIEVDVAGDSIRAERKTLEGNRERVATLRAALEVAKATGDDIAYAQAIRELTDFQRQEQEHVAVLRKKIAMEKVPYVVDHVRNILLDPDRKVLVFAHHHCVIEALYEAFSEIYPNGVVHFYGDSTPDEKKDAERRIQNDPSCRIFIGGITAAGTGLTLTGAQHVVFAEEDWVPSNMRQCEGRAWRKGQTVSVLVEHIVAYGSVDSLIAKRMIAKQEISDQAIDAGLTLDEPIDWIEDHRLPTLPELEKETTPYQRTAYGYGLSKLVANPRHYNVTDLHLIIASRLAGKELKGKAAAYARWLCRTYLGASDDEPVKLPDRSF